MAVGMGDIAAFLVLAAFCVPAWLQRRNVGGKTWAFRIVPLGIVLLYKNVYGLPDSWYLPLCRALLLLTFVAYAFAAYRGGWRLAHPKNRWLRGAWWMTHIVVYFLMILVLCFFAATVARVVVRLSPLAMESDWPWTKGRITDELPFAVEYKRAKTLCAEYDKRLLFKSGKRVGLQIDTCGYGPFRVYRLRDGNYCLVDGYDIKADLPDVPRYYRINVEKETVEHKQDDNWYAIPEKGYVRGCGGVVGENVKHFDMYPGGSLNTTEGWIVCVTGTPVGDSLDGMRLIGKINTSGKFKSVDQGDER